MPELPEVETTLRGIEPYIVGRKMTAVHVRHPCLRWPIPAGLHELLQGQTLLSVERRAKYLLFKFKKGTLLLHLGMSGKLRILLTSTSPQKHDHVDLCFANSIVRFTDPRRFGALLWTDNDPTQHPLLADIGPEPLTNAFNTDYLFNKTRGRAAQIKVFIMDAKIVAGVGNIYATEALFQAGIKPQRPAGKITFAECQVLVTAIKTILKRAIKKGGTTLKDFAKSDGSPGYFNIELLAYGRAGEACVRCAATLKLARLGQRSTVYCSHCQK